MHRPSPARSTAAAGSSNSGATRPGALVLYVLAVAVVALAYYGAGRIGLELAYLNGAVAALWPPAGLGLAVLFLYGVRLWPAIVIGDLLLGDYSTPLGTVLAQTVGNTLAWSWSAALLCAASRVGGPGWTGSPTCWPSSGARWSRRWSAPRSGRCRCGSAM